MLSHDNVTWTAVVCCQILNVRETSDVVSYLPLSHIAAQLVVSTSVPVSGPVSGEC